MSRRWLVLGVFVLALALGGSGVALSRSGAGDAKSKRHELEGAFLGHLAKELGVDEARLRKALAVAGIATIDDAVKAGLLTKEQAASLKRRLSAGNLDDLELGLGFGRFKHGPRGFGKHGLGHHRFAALGALLDDTRARTAIADAIAKRLGTTREGLAKALAEEEGLEALMASKKVTEADLGAAAAAAAEPHLDRLVRAGTLTRADADLLLERLRAGAFVGKLAKLAVLAR